MVTRAPHARSTSQSPKTMRHFYCADELWRLFQEMASEFNCGVDYLLNEAMRHYARAKKRLPPSPSPSPPPPPSPPSPSPSPRPRTPPPPPLRPVGPTLVLFFSQQQIAIAKDQFVIGRKQAGTDLVIKDGNISRRHAVIIRRDGAFYFKDLGSTNGITFRGARIEGKRIDDGDVFQICDYELRFAYR